MDELKKATLQKIYVNQGERGSYLRLFLSNIDGSVEKLMLFDQWYFEEGTEHDIRKHEGEPIEYNTITREKGDKTYINIVHIQPEGQIWERPEKARGGASPGKAEIVTALGRIVVAIENLTAMLEHRE